MSTTKPNGFGFGALDPWPAPEPATTPETEAVPEPEMPPAAVPATEAK